MSKKYKIEIEVSEDDFNTYTNTEEYSDATAKLRKAFEEAKEKEIKVGDFVYSRTRDCIETAKSNELSYPLYTKLPQSLQDGLNEFIKGKL